MRVKGFICVCLAVCLVIVILPVTAVSAPRAAGSQAPRGDALQGISWTNIFQFALKALGELDFGTILELLGIDSPTTKILKKLEQMDAKLDQVIDLEKAILKELQELEQRLAIDVKEIEQYIKEVNIEAAETEIDTFFNHFEAQFGDKKPGQVSKTAIAKYAADVMNGLKIENDITAINHGILPTQSQEGVLDLLTDQCIMKLSAISDLSAVVESPGNLPLVVERPTYFNFDSTFAGGHNKMGAIEPVKKAYFAEGSSRPDFETFFCIENPWDDESLVKMTYMKGDGTSSEQTLRLEGNSRATVNAKDFLGEGDDVGHDFSCVVETTNNKTIVVERPMYFEYLGSWDDGHIVVGETSPASEFYFAEGTCRPNFDPYLCIQNPGGSAADVKITYMKGDGSSSKQALSVDARSRATVKVKDLLGEGDDSAHDFSCKVETTNGTKILVERPMYFQYRGAWDGGHVVSGETAPESRYYFAEGTCRPGFDPYLCIQNPGDSAANVKITYIKGDGNESEQTLSVGARSRVTVTVKEFLGEADDEAHDFSCVVESINDKPIVAERPIYFEYRDGWSGGHCEKGMSEPSNIFYFAEGNTLEDFEPYLCFQNPNAVDADVDVTYFTDEGTMLEQELTVEGRSRSTISANDAPGYNYYHMLETYFAKLLVYQLRGATLVCEAMNTNPKAYGSSKDFMNKTFYPMINAEVEKYLSCVERFVFSKATMIPSSSTDSPLPDWGPDVLSKADYVAAISKYPNEFGLKGRIIATQDYVPSGQTLALTARKGEATFGSSGAPTENFVQYISGGNIANHYYPVWSGEGFNFRNLWSVVRYTFPDVKEEGAYEILDAGGNVIARSDARTFETSSGNVVFGDFVDSSRMLNTAHLLHTSRWTKLEAKKDPYPGYGRADAIANLDSKAMTASAKLVTGPPETADAIVKIDCNMGEYRGENTQAKVSFSAHVDGTIEADSDMAFAHPIDAEIEYFFIVNNASMGPMPVPMAIKVDSRKGKYPERETGFGQLELVETLPFPLQKGLKYSFTIMIRTSITCQADPYSSLSFNLGGHVNARLKNLSLHI